MPELPEVETTRRGLLGAVVGQRIAQVTVRRYDLRQPIPKNLSGILVGTTITHVRRRAKYLLIDLDSGHVLLAHLGMSGSFTVRGKAGYVPKIHDHVIIELKNNLLVVFHDPRRFGVMDVLASGEEVAHPLLKNLGPEPLEKEFSSRYLQAQLARRKGPIKPVLMDQRLVVGVGNIYASEALHLSGLNPSLSACSVAAKAPAIVNAIQATLTAAIASGGSTLRDYVGATNEGGYFQHEFKVMDAMAHPVLHAAQSLKLALTLGARPIGVRNVSQSALKRKNARVFKGCARHGKSFFGLCIKALDGCKSGR